jgi:hypothetical protein
MERLLVGVDGSGVAHDALVWSSDLARRMGVELVAARVFIPRRPSFDPSST